MSFILHNRNKTLVIPTDSEIQSLYDNSKLITEVMILVGFSKSINEGKKLILGGGIKVDDKKISDPFAKIFRITDNVLLVIEKALK